MSALSASPSSPGRDDAATGLDGAFAEAMREVVTATSGAAHRPGQIRVLLQQRLGPDHSARLRARVHHVVVAAEERLPATLGSLAPVTEPVLRRVASDLAARRGWTFETAHRATLDWALALGLTEPHDPSPASSPGGPEAGQPLPNSVTSLVWVPVREVPPVEEVPPESDPLVAGHVVRDTEWPRMAGSVADILGRNRFSAPAGALAYIGLRRGLLMVAPEGLVFVRLRGRRLRPDALTLAAPWVDIQVKQTGSGRFLSFGWVELGDRAVRVSPKGHRLLAAIQAGAR